MKAIVYTFTKQFGRKKSDVIQNLAGMFSKLKLNKKPANNETLETLLSARTFQTTATHNNKTGDKLQRNKSSKSHVRMNVIFLFVLPSKF